MLVSALVATLVGFGLLVVALVTGTLWLAVACIVVCVLGALLLVADILGLSPALARLRPRRSARPASAVDEPSAIDDDPDTAITTEMARVVDEPVPDLSTDLPGSPVPTADAQAAAAYAAAHHGRHESPDDEPADTHAHVRRDTDPPAAMPWLTPATPRRHTRHSGDTEAGPAEVTEQDTDTTTPRRHRHAAD
ncbi:hypothetical protein ACQ7HM_16835 [Williamsia sp. MIQD14]|uniref:hypothetical protein n=1 Tax=Williamsia sp. MIQD14 TaxID=3425703 RepID=UPI003DA0B4FA